MTTIATVQREIEDWLLRIYTPAFLDLVGTMRCWAVALRESRSEPDMALVAMVHEATRISAGMTHPTAYPVMRDAAIEAGNLAAKEATAVAFSPLAALTANTPLVHDLLGAALHAAREAATRNAIRQPSNRLIDVHTASYRAEVAARDALGATTATLTESARGMAQRIAAA